MKFTNEEIIVVLRFDKLSIMSAVALALVGRGNNKIPKCVGWEIIDKINISLTI
ncbi:MAG: hypothetical protein ACR5KW_03870 [Wolbachia sp.]